MTDTAAILSHHSNSGIIQMPGRRFPGIAMQGDSVICLYRCLLAVLADAKHRRDEDTYYEVFPFAATIEGHLVHYEQTLSSLGMQLPWPTSVTKAPLVDDYDEA